MRAATRPVLRASLLFACLAVWPGTAALAQALLPAAQDLSLSLNLSNVLNKKHYNFAGDELDVGHTTTDTIALQAAWAPADRWLLAAGLPWVRTEFHGGSSAHGPEVDHGHGNTYFTDLRVELHYQALEFPVAVAPYVAFVVPTNHYPTLGHAAPGRGLNETWLGLFTGTSIDALPGSYLQLRYNYAFVEEVAGRHHDHSILDLELDYFITEKWSALLLGSKRWAHGGIDLPVPASDPLFPYHDQLGATEFLNITGGVAWSPTERYSVFASYTRSLQGRNAHKVDRGLALSFGWRPIPR